MVTDEQSTIADAAAIREQLAKILRSAPFVRSNRIVDFFSYIVESTVEGNYDVLKETLIGYKVFGREPSYDTKIDPIVRVEARRLRSKLHEYYTSEGIHDALVISLPKGGYRPTIEVRDIAPVPEAPAAEPLTAVTVPAEKPRRRTGLIAVVAVNAVVISLAAWWLWAHNARTRSSRVQPLTSYIGQEFNPAVSPDGKHLAFVWDSDRAHYAIYVKTLPEGEPVAITSGEGHDLHPSWSPDGRDVAFLRVTPDRSTVITVPATGGPEHVLGEVHTSISIWKADALQMYGSLGPAWSPDGKSLAVDDGGSLMLWPLGFGERRAITHAAMGSNDFYPAFSPDGSSVAFVRQTSNSTADLYVASLSAPDPDHPRRLTSDRADIRGVTWVPDGKSIVLSSQRQGSYALWRVYLEGARVDAVPIGSSQALEPSLSQSGNLLTYTDIRQNTNIWRVDLGSRAPAQPVRLIASSRHNNSPQYSPNGEHIVFVSDRSGSWELWLSDADGSHTRQLTNFHGPLLGSPHWSPDGSQIAFDARPADHSAIFLIHADGSDLRQLNHGDDEERMPSWSADGRWLYFNSTRGGAVHLWKMPATGGDAVQVTDRAAYDSFEADGGRTIYFRGDGLGIWRIAPGPGAVSSLVPGLEEVEPSRYLAVTATDLYFVDREEEPRRLKQFHYATGKITTLTTLNHPLVSGTPSLSISPDVRYALVTQQDESQSDIFSVPWSSVR